MSAERFNHIFPGGRGGNNFVSLYGKVNPIGGKARLTLKHIAAHTSEAYHAVSFRSAR